MRSRDAPDRCPICNGRLTTIGTRRRRFIPDDGDKSTLIIRRRRCKECGRIHHELPDILLPHKLHVAATFEKIHAGDLWDVCCDDNTARRIRWWLAQVLLPMAAGLLSPLPCIGRALLLNKLSDSPPGCLPIIVFYLVNGNLWHTRFAVPSG